MCLEHPYNKFRLVSDRIRDGKVTVHNIKEIQERIRKENSCDHRRRSNGRII